VTLRALFILILAIGAPACAHSFDVEGRETQINVWLTVPHLAKEGGTIDALVYVGPYKVVQGPVVFAKGSPTVNLPPIFIRAGAYDIAAILDGGRFSVRENLDIEDESWVQVVLRENRITLEYDDEQPDPWGR
jgi:hypothetical protein